MYGDIRVIHWGPWTARVKLSDKVPQSTSILYAHRHVVWSDGIPSYVGCGRGHKCSRCGERPPEELGRLAKLHLLERAGL